MENGGYPIQIISKMSLYDQFPSKIRRKAKFLGFAINTLGIFHKRSATQKAWDIFAKPRVGRIKEKDREILDKSTKKILEIEGHKISTYSWGEGEKIIYLVHGWESNAARWKFMLELIIRPEFTIISFDAPGHGASSGDQLNLYLYSKTLKGVAEHFGKPYAMIGHSLGGMCIAKTISVNPSLSPAKVVLMGSYHNTVPIFKEFSEFLGLSSKIQKGLSKRVKDISGIPVENFSIEQWSKGGLDQIPTLLVYDKNDVIVPIHSGYEMKKHLKASFLFETQGIGHALNGKAIAEKVNEFILKDLTLQNPISL
jgi:esterase/lipase